MQNTRNITSIKHKYRIHKASSIHISVNRELAILTLKDIYGVASVPEHASNSELEELLRKAYFRGDFAFLVTVAN